MSETLELTVIDEKSMKHLSLPTQKLIKDLSKELNVEKLQLFNPLVETMITIEGFKDIKYNEEDPETIQQYKDASKVIKSFRASTKRAKSALKKPILETGKKLDTIEKTFVGRATDVLEALLEEFKPYIEEEARLKQEREDRKNKATIEKIEQLSDETIQQQLVMARMNAKMRIDAELNSFVPDAVEKAQTFSKEALSKQIEALKELKIQGYTFNDDDIALLLEDQAEEIKKTFYRNIDSSIAILEMAFSKPDLSSAPPLPPPPKPVDLMDIEVNESGISFVAPSITQENPDYFSNAISDILDDAIESISNLNPAEPREGIIKKELIDYLTQLQTKATDYLS